MVDQSAGTLVPPHKYRHLESIESKIGTQVIRDLPAENTAGEKFITKAVYTRPETV